jgi:hypothetical protein
VYSLALVTRFLQAGVLQGADIEGRGKLAMHEFDVAGMESDAGREESVKSLFDKLDANGDGYVSLGEYGYLGNMVLYLGCACVESAPSLHHANILLAACLQRNWEW